MSKLINLLNNHCGNLSDDEIAAISSFVKLNMKNHKLTAIKQDGPKFPLGVAHFDGFPHNPISGFELSGEQYEVLCGLDFIGQYATKKQWASIGRVVIGEPVLTTETWGRQVFYYAYEQTK